MVRRWHWRLDFRPVLTPCYAASEGDKTSNMSNAILVTWYNFGSLSRTITLRLPENYPSLDSRQNLRKGFPKVLWNSPEIALRDDTPRGKSHTLLGACTLHPFILLLKVSSSLSKWMTNVFRSLLVLLVGAQCACRQSRNVIVLFESWAPSD